MPTRRPIATAAALLALLSGVAGSTALAASDGREAKVSQRSAGGVEPSQRGNRHYQIHHRPQDLSTKARQQSQQMDAVASLGHIRGWPALEVPIAHAWDLLEECDPQASFQVPAEA